MPKRKPVSVKAWAVVWLDVGHYPGFSVDLMPSRASARIYAKDGLTDQDKGRVIRVSVKEIRK